MGGDFLYDIAPMEIINRVARMSDISRKLLTADVKIGLVPTMGAIHPGHLSLIHSARRMTDVVVVSIFVNRLQFLTDTEYAQYPRDITKDVDILRDENVDYVFTPSEEEMYPPGFSTYVTVDGLADKIPGLQNSTFFKGMTTGAMKMLQIVKPSFVFLGQKDGLHGAIMRKMMTDLNTNTEVVVTPVVRDSSGLAYAARNYFLGDAEKRAAAVIFRSLKAAEQAIAGGEVQSRKIVKVISTVIASEPSARLEYAVSVDPVTLDPVSKIEGSALIGVGATIGQTLLNDSLLIEAAPKS
jgi:pantoate--beta-alanine ligase